MNLQSPLEDLLANPLPFQMEITYKSLDGCQYTRVITMQLPVSMDRSQCAD